MLAQRLQERSALHRRDRLRARVRLLFGGVFVMLVLVLGGGMWLHREQTLSSAQTRAENLADILGDHLGRTVGAIDAALTQLALHSQRVGGPGAAASAWTPVLDATLAGLAGVGALTVTDETGIVIHSTLAPIVGQSRADRWLFRQIASDPAAGLVADTPFAGMRNGKFLMPLGRRLTTADGRFAGLVVATLEPELLRGFYRTIDVGPNGLSWVLHPAGYVMIREPSAVDPIGQSAHGNPLLVHAQDGPAAGYLHAPLTPAGRPYLSAYRRLAYPPLVVAVSLAEGDVLAEWRHAALIASALVAVVGLLLAFAFLSINGEIRARAQAERRASLQAEALSAALGERDRAGAALRITEARFQAIMDHAPLVVTVRDRAGRYLFVNRMWEQLTGVPAAEAVGQRAEQFWSKDLIDRRNEIDAQVFATRKPHQTELVLDMPSGPRTAFVVKFPLGDPAGEIDAIGTVSVDITSQKQAEQQLAHAQKMDAVGQLTGGVAHDFNNMLTAILLNADVLASQLQDESLRALAEAMRAAAERGAELTGRLLAFGRRQTLAPQPTNVNELLAGMERLMRRTLGENIEIKLLCDDDLWLATVDPGQLENAVLNLAVNARDAMPQGGRLTFRTANVELDAEDAAIDLDAKAGQYVMIVATDTGTGMTPDVLARAFEPFFTTKEVGKGTGLGLSMVYGFVKQSEGHVRIYSERGMGTAIKLYLPRSQQARALAPAPPAAPVRLATGNETILLVEDDRLVRAHTTIQLRDLGYDVVAAEHAQQALEAVERGCVPDLLFTDIVMPGPLNGRDLAQKLSRRWPNLKVLYTSGYAHGAIDAAGADSVFGRHMLAKPYRRRDLAAKVREVLDEAIAAAS
jgi:PAS domain S-box-containing protein